MYQFIFCAIGRLEEDQAALIFNVDPRINSKNQLKKSKHIKTDARLLRFFSNFQPEPVSSLFAILLVKSEVQYSILIESCQFPSCSRFPSISLISSILISSEDAVTSLLNLHVNVTETEKSSAIKKIFSDPS